MVKFILFLKDRSLFLCHKGSAGLVWQLHKTFRNPGSFQSIMLSSQEFVAYPHGPRWQPELHTPHLYSRKKTRGWEKVHFIWCTIYRVLSNTGSCVATTIIKIRKIPSPKKFPPAATLLSTLVPIPSSWQTLIYFIFLEYYLV